MGWWTLHIHLTTVLIIIILNNVTTEFGSTDKPIIFPLEDFITLEPGLNFTFTCEGRRPVEWRVGDDFVGNYKQKVNSQKTDDYWTSDLTLYDITIDNVRFYYCIFRDDNHISDSEELINLNKASRIYVFVNDRSTLLMPIEQTLIDAKENEVVIIPCKPTSKDTEIILTKFGSVENQSYDPRYGFTIYEFNSEHEGPYNCKCAPNVSADTKVLEECFHSVHLQLNIDADYNPTEGFSISVESIHDAGDYKCEVVDRPDQYYDFLIKFLATDEDNLTSGGVSFILSRDKRSKRDFVKKPTIHSKTDGFIQTGQDLELSCEIELDSPVAMFDIIWSTPHGNKSIEDGRSEKNTSIDNVNSSIGVGHLVVHDTNKEDDTGEYKCHVIMHSSENFASTYVKVLNDNEGHLEIEDEGGKYEIKLSAGKTAKWYVKVIGYPLPRSQWYDNFGKEINNDLMGGKHTIQLTKNHTQLIIKNLEISDSGIYTLKASNSFEEQTKEFKLTVKEKPTVSMQNKEYIIKDGEETEFSCTVVGYPKSVVKWYYSCRTTWLENDCPFEEDTLLNENQSSIDMTNLAINSVIKYTPTKPGTIKCVARNSEGTGSDEGEVILSDYDFHNALDIWGINPNSKMTEGDLVVVKCGGLKYKITPEITWNRMDGKPIHGVIVEENTDHSYIKTLTFDHISISDSAQYTCIAINRKTSEEITTNVDIQVHEQRYPEIIHKSFDSEMEKTLTEAVELQCNVEGMPEPSINWYKNDELITVSDDERIMLLELNSTLYIKYAKAEDEGVYKCEVSNRLGVVSESVNLRLAKNKLSTWIIVIIVTLIILLLLLIVYLTWRVRRTKREYRALRAAGLSKFQEGNPACISSDLTVDEQADLLPYDRKYEFPKDKLTLGKRLGAGAFGVVMKAQAVGIHPYEPETTVAVKMVKPTADNEVIKALVTELKIMVHLGQHLNVVNLLGAVTKNIAKREIMVIVEYCRYGNLHSFLLKNRNRFIDQIDRYTDKIDSSIIEKRQSDDSGYDINSHGLKYAKLDFTPADMRNDNYISHNMIPQIRQSEGNKSIQYIRQSDIYVGESLNTAQTDTTLLSNNQADDYKKAWRTDYKSDSKDPVDNITTTSLVCWAYQIARGMDYLATRKVLHGDLAARNILLCDDNVVKICDFGLARSIYKNDNYKKTGESPLPFKWLAIESIRDQVFSTQSDVWAFGIVLWELFSLCKTPYPGMEADQTLYFKLRDGYRMDKPDYSTQEIYDIMLHCWNASPEKRPTFRSLEYKFGGMLESGVKDHYLDLNEPYMQMNSELIGNAERDYLAMMGPPDVLAPRPPSYVNTKQMPNNGNEYLIVNEISPSSSKNPFIANRPFTDKDAPEEIPMLSKTLNRTSDSETEQDNEKVKQPPVASPRNTNNKYVNVNSLMADNSVSNPTYIDMHRINERH